MLPTISGEFRVVADPDLRFTPSGKAVADVRLVASKRKKDESTGEWVDDKTFWISGSAWDKFAENIAETLRKGMLVTVTGAIYTDSYEDGEGNKRSKDQIQLYSIGPSLQYATATVKQAERSSGGQSSGQGQSGGQSRGPVTDPWAADPWAAAPESGTKEPPF